MLAQRWRKLVQRRSWTDRSGKHKTFAKYLDHDPDFQWVKLLVLTGKGETQTEKEVTVPVGETRQERPVGGQTDCLRAGTS